jgi:hypothetical protein
MKKLLVLLAVAAMVAFAAPAFAANPFADVPMNHWAYDAVGQLAADGVVSGYPDGSYKGGQPATRYEMASLVARALAKVDLTKASKQDVELLKKLVVEFKDELDALGVKVDKLDARVAVLEERLGGWKMNGEFRMRMDWLDNSSSTNDKTDFRIRTRLVFQKQIDDKVSFYSQLQSDFNDNNAETTELYFRQVYLNVKLPWDVNMRLGRQNIDWFDEEGLYVDNDSLFGDDIVTGARFDKDFGMGRFSAYVAHGDVMQGADNGEGSGLFGYDVNNDNMYQYAVMFKIQPNEKFGGRAFGYWYDFTENGGFVTSTLYANLTTGLVSNYTFTSASDCGFGAWGLNGFVNFTPNIGLDLLYFQEDLDDAWVYAANGDDSPATWQAILNVKQDALKFTDLRIEYTKSDKNWLAWHDLYANYRDDVLYSLSGPVYANDTTSLFIKANQRWNDQWGTFLRYVTAEMDEYVTGWGDPSVDDFSVGVVYNYTPALAFTFVYDTVNYDNNYLGYQDDHLFRIQTEVKF